MLTVKASQFTWHSKSRTMTVEISDLGWSGFPMSFLVDSQKFDSKIMFEMIEMQKQEEDVLFAVYRPMQTISSISDVRITIFND